MYFLRLCCTGCAIFFLFSACNNTPDHARYIPKEAVAVTGINLRELSKEIGWSVLSGSSLFEELTRKLPENRSSAAEGLNNAGIDAVNTCYLYLQQPPQTGSFIRTTALIPLASAAKWETYIQQYFDVPVREINGRKEAALTAFLYAAWNDHLLVILHRTDTHISFDTNKQETEEAFATPADDFDQTMFSDQTESIFNLQEEQALTSDKRFRSLEKQNHDITFWVNYDVLYNRLRNNFNGAAAGLSLTGSLWKDAAAATGFDFEKGKISGTAKFYTGEAIAEVAEKFAVAADYELIERLPAENLQMLAAFHCAPEGIKAVLENTGLLGFLNLGLTSSGINGNDLFEAFTGDMGFSMYKLDPTFVSTEKGVSLSGFGAVYAMKINDRGAFDRIHHFCVENGLIKAFDANTWVLDSMDDTLFMVVGGTYLAWSNDLSVAHAYIEGDYKKQTGRERIQKEAKGHTMVWLADYGTILQSLETMASTPHERAGIARLHDLLEYAVINGGTYRQDAFHYQMALHFKNKKENSLIQLLHFLSKMQELLTEETAHTHL